MLMRPIWPAWYSLNQSSPSRTTSDSGRQSGVRPRENSVTAPSGVMRPTRLTWASENHTFPSGPATMPSGPAPTVGTGNSVTAPDVVIRPIPVAGVLAEPQRPIGGRGDPDRPAVWRWPIEFDEAPIAGIHSADLGCPAFAEPKVPVRTEYDDVRLALRRRNRMQDYLNVSHRPSSLYCRRGEWRGYASHAADPSDLGPLPRGDVPYPRMVVAPSNGNAEQPRGVGA